MGHGPEHHIEHAEHAAHAAHDEFNKRVTMSIAIVAAVLACVTMMSHRAHNETLRLQGEALKQQTQASIKSTKAANKWSYYQNKNTFNFESEIVVDLLKVLATREGAAKDLKDVMDRYEDNVDYYSGDKNSRMSGKRLKKPKAAESADGKSDGKPKKAEDGEAKSDDDAKAKKAKPADGAKKKPEGKLKTALEEASKLDEEAEALIVASEKTLEESHVVHAKAARFDFGELGLQFGVVLCSLAILTKSRSFWMAGMISAVIGLVIALTGLLGLFLGHH